MGGDTCFDLTQELRELNRLLKSSDNKEEGGLLVVSGWNTYSPSLPENSQVWCLNVSCDNVKSALDEAEKICLSWNKGESLDSKQQVNFITCRGLIRVV